MEEAMAGQVRRESVIPDSLPPAVKQGVGK
jgi:hypothetical protein